MTQVRALSRREAQRTFSPGRFIVWWSHDENSYVTALVVGWFSDRPKGTIRWNLVLLEGGQLRTMPYERFISMNIIDVIV